MQNTHMTWMWAVSCVCMCVLDDDDENILDLNRFTALSFALSTLLGWLCRWKVSVSALCAVGYLQTKRSDWCHATEGFSLSSNPPFFVLILRWRKMHRKAIMVWRSFSYVCHDMAAYTVWTLSRHVQMCNDKRNAFVFASRQKKKVHFIHATATYSCNTQQLHNFNEMNYRLLLPICVMHGCHSYDGV